MKLRGTNIRQYEQGTLQGDCIHAHHEWFGAMVRRLLASREGDDGIKKSEHIFKRQTSNSAPGCFKQN